MKIRTLYILLMLLALAGVGFAAGECEEPKVSEIDAYLNGKGFQGSALVAKKGEILLSKGYGLANREHQIANTSDTVYRIGSISKLFTAVAVLQLQEKGLLKVTDPVSKYVPDYPRGDEITIHHLLSHSSGIASIYHFPNLLDIQRQATDPVRAMEHFKHLPLKFVPGTDTDSTDSGYIILGAIIEQVTNNSYEAYLKEAIFRPLSLNTTYYEQNKYVIPHRASGYYTDGGTYYHAPFIDMSLPHAAGALSSTVEDLYRFDQAVRGEQFLTQKMREALFTVHGTNAERQIAAGYGYRIGPLNRGMVGCAPGIVGHFATIDGFEGAMISYLDDDLVIILLSNVQKTDLRTFHKDIADLIHSPWRKRA